MRRKITYAQFQTFLPAIESYREKFSDTLDSKAERPFRVSDKIVIERKGDKLSMRITITAPPDFKFDAKEYGLPVRQYLGVPVHYVNAAQATTRLVPFTFPRKGFAAHGEVITEGDPRGRASKIYR